MTLCGEHKEGSYIHIDKTDKMVIGDRLLMWVRKHHKGPA
jgi:hypothetical protein